MSDSEDGGPGRRETAYRLFASEFEDADFSYAESDEERTPNYVVTPTGARINRLFVVGVLTEVTPVSDDVLRARVVDPTGAFVVYAGQYQPEAQAFLDRAEPPTFVAVSGKARTFQPEDSDVTYTSIRPESVNEVDADTRDRWVVQTAEQTLARIADVASALQSDVRGDELRSALDADGVSEGLAAGIPLAIDHYGTGGAYLQALRETALDAVRVVAGEIDEVEDRSVAPDATGEVDLSALTDRHLDTSGATPAEPGAESPAGAVDEAIESTAEADSRAGSAAEAANSEPEQESAVTAESTSDETAASTSSEPSEASSSQPAAAGSESAADTSETDTADTPSTSAAETAATETDASGSTADSEDIGDFEPGEFDLDEETREEVESEYGTEFQSGTEVEEPGEADIETPDPEDVEAAESAGAPAGAADAEAAPDSAGAPAGDESATPSESAATTDAVTETPETDTEAGADEEAGEVDATDADEEDVSGADLEDAVMDAMRDLDDGEGADREGVIAAVVEQTGADPGDVEEAIQEALMNGRCYEPDDETLTPI